MSLDNAAIDRVEHRYNPDDLSHADDCPCDSPDPFSTMTDRELAEYNARLLTEIVSKVNGVVDSVGPAMDKLSKNPLLGGLFR